MRDLYEGIKKLLQDKAFVVFVVFTALLSFGFGITHVSVGIDDLCFDRYVMGTWMLSANRWGTWAFYNLFKITSFSPFWLELLTVTMYFMTALVICSALKIITKDKLSKVSYILLGAGYISFPILCFQFLYQSTNITVAFSNLIFILVAYLIWDNLKNKKNKLWFILYMFLGAFSVACYESCIQTFAVVALIFTVMWVLYSEDKVKFKDIFVHGIIYILVLAISIGLYLGIGKLITMHLEKIGQLHDTPAYSTTIFEMEQSYKEFLDQRYKELYSENTNDVFVFILTGASAGFLVCAIIQGVRNKKYHIIWLSILAVLANLAFLMIFDNLLFRMYYSWTILAGFEYLFIYETALSIEWIRKIKLDKVVIVLIAFIILIQTKETNKYIFEDWRVNEEAKNKFILIGNTIKSQCSIPGKKVVYKYEGLTMTSTFDWAVNVFDDMGAVITQYINFNGFFIQNSGWRWEETLWMVPGDYENRRVINSYVSEGEHYIYVEINQD